MTLMGHFFVSLKTRERAAPVALEPCLQNMSNEKSIRQLLLPWEERGDDYDS